MAAMQGAAFAATYTTPRARAEFAVALSSTPATGVLYGESKNLASTAGYVVYRIMPFMALIAATWGLMTATRILRGQEEDDRLELIAAGATTKTRTARDLYIGFCASITVASILAAVVTAAVTTQSDIGMTFQACWLLSLGIFLPALLFAGLGAITSQLTTSRRRAIFFGIVPIFVFFVIRSIANIVDGLYFLKNITPFGWTDMISPVYDPQIWWIAPFVVASLLLAAVGILLSKFRDLGAGLLPETTSVRPRFFLLKNSTSLALRLNGPVLFGWTAGVLAISILMALLSKVAVDALTDSPSLQTIIGQLGGSTGDMSVAFLGAGLLFTVILLMLMVTVGIGAIRNDEARGHLDTLLAHPVRRSVWLTGRVGLLAATSIAVALVACITTWAVATSQGITLDFFIVLQVGVSLVGTVLFLLGLGTLAYSLFPRIATIVMYAVIVWSFIIDTLAAVLALNDFVTRTSLLHYASVSLASAPDWQTFVWLGILGAVMAGLGITKFTKRDIIAE
jgi:ABC-2 type transport system permease protein